MMTVEPDRPEAFERRAKADRSIATLLSDLASETSLLIRTELALFKAELQEKLGFAGQGIAALGAGALIAFSGWLVLLAAAVLGLAEVLAPWLAALIVGVVVLLIGAGLLFFGKRRLSAQTLRPERSLRSLREDQVWLQERLQ
jgi:hypothetical protein